nr:hypothetical protein CFP56_74137 [Quercus suber]
MEQLSGWQYGEWLKDGGVIKNGGEKEKVNVQSEAGKRSSPFMVVDGRDGEEDEVVRGSSPALVVGGGAGEEGGTIVMMDVAPLDMMKGSVSCNVTSSHREQGEQIGWDNRVPEASKMGLEQIAHDEQKGVRAGLVRNEVRGNEVGQVVVDKKCGLGIREGEVLSPIEPKEKEGLSKERNRQLQSPGHMVKQVASGRKKK